MAHQGIAFFDAKGHYFKSADEATQSDLAALLGRIGDGDSLAPGIAVMLLERRAEVERIFSEHDKMVLESKAAQEHAQKSTGNVTPLPIGGQEA